MSAPLHINTNPICTSQNLSIPYLTPTIGETLTTREAKSASRVVRVSPVLDACAVPWGMGWMDSFCSVVSSGNM